MNGRFLLDTNIVIALFAEDTSVQKGLTEAVALGVKSRQAVAQMQFTQWGCSRLVT